MGLAIGKTRVFLGKFDPSCQFQLAGGGGAPDGILLDFRAFLALRQLPGLARGGAQWSACVRKTCRRNAIDISLLWRFISERVATWQSTRQKVANCCHLMSYTRRVLCQPPTKFGKVAKNRRQRCHSSAPRCRAFGHENIGYNDSHQTAARMESGWNFSIAELCT